ncbi:hypothetical protein SAMN05892883_3703 [Jatrophihabitans sp. GAS493]|uniref:hypothetical protein n=1 Tax=Jatrophihabitans sp. GAS493 TaxID=1907575 RepID=UPI000BC0B6FF|nr:hypothetical protein [Jatrophihabitans sp. GAS493]SOD74517.1 hypothetical protein SAMN05892883_3703 [Jatrophihabitans sp. GAS493]
MTISLVSAPIIGFDLVRHPHGSAVAEILLLGLSLEAQDLPLFATGSASDPGFGLWRARAIATDPISRPLRSVRDTRRSGAAVSEARPVQARPADPRPETNPSLSAQEQLASAIDALLHSMIIDIDVLEQLIRRDVLGWCTPGSPFPMGETESQRGVPVDPDHARLAANALVDAIAAEWVADLDDEFAARLRTPLDRVRGGLPHRAPNVGPCALPIMRILQDLRQLGPDGCIRLRGVNTVLGSGVETWAAAVHETSWAVMTTGRVHAAATAQLLAVQAFGESGLNAADGAEGIWNIVSGHLHASVVGDVLAEETKQSLAKAWVTALAS